jgi:recombination protein RecA
VAKRASSSQSAEARVEGGGNYFAAPKTNIEFISSGCLTLDLALGGGWAENRIANIVGDKSSGKTLLAIEAAANFGLKYPKGKIRYREAEAAFDMAYAASLGMPVDRVDFDKPIETVEDMFEDLEKVIAGARQPELYILDSLDSLSDRAELARDMDEGTYGAQKAKNLSQMFRRTVRRLGRAHVTCMIISQVRSKIGVSFGRNTTRSGGRALDFYASQVLYLNSADLEKRSMRGETRAVGINVKARCDKNKISLPFRDAAFQIRFGYGVDSIGSSLDWLKKIKRLEDVGLSSKMKDEDLRDLKRSYMTAGFEADVAPEAIAEAVRKNWYEIEGKFVPSGKKYG